MDSLIDLGYPGLFLGSFLASTIVPFSSDLLLVGILALGANPWIALFAATAGNWLGGMTSYGIGWLGKWKWIEKLGVSHEKLQKQKQHVEKWGSWLAFITWLPVVGDLIAVALGFYKVRPALCSVYMLIGRFSRFLVLTLIYIRWGEQFVTWITG